MVVRTSYATAVLLLCRLVRDSAREYHREQGFGMGYGQAKRGGHRDAAEQGALWWVCSPYTLQCFYCIA